MSHFASCSDCKSLFDAHNRITSAIQHSGQVSPPPDFSGKIMKRIGTPISPSFLPTGILAARNSIVIGVGIAFAAIGLLIMSLSDRSDDPAKIDSAKGLKIATGSFLIKTDQYGNTATLSKNASQGVSIDRTPD
ncbi:MAG: hypothetical protein WA705_30405 [Candidatus Ozemobacteraceae bacterium]